MYVADSPCIDDRINGRSFPRVFLVSDVPRFTTATQAKEMHGQFQGRNRAHLYFLPIYVAVSFQNRLINRTSRRNLIVYSYVIDM